MLEIAVTIRTRNRLPIPQSVADRHGIEPWQRLVIVDRGVEDEFTVRVVRSSYAGALVGVFGTTDENLAYARGERDAWRR